MIRRRNPCVCVLFLPLFNFNYDVIDAMFTNLILLNKLYFELFNERI